MDSARERSNRCGLREGERLEVGRAGSAGRWTSVTSLRESESDPQDGADSSLGGPGTRDSSMGVSGTGWSASELVRPMDGIWAGAAEPTNRSNNCVRRCGGDVGLRSSCRSG